MDLLKKHLLQIADALPVQFDFYHLGEVVQSPVEYEFEETVAIGLRLYGDVTAFMIVYFSNQLDMSVYSELSNILASQMVTHLNKKNGIDIMVSPPHVLTQQQIRSLVLNSPSPVRRTYAHFYKNSVIPVETWILPIFPEGIGYA